MIVAEDTKVVFNFLINPLCLAIGLGMVSCASIALDVEKSVEVAHECRYEIGTTVADNFSGQPMTSKDVVPECSGNTERGNLCACRDYFDHFGKAINDN
jgi:hypothetical protein